MKYIKNFTDAHSLTMYKKTNFVTPHVYFNNSAKTFDYMKKYIPLEYISSTKTGGQYINLNCHLLENTDDIKIDIKFNIKNRGKNSVNTQGTLIAAQPETSPYPGFTLRYNTSNSDTFIQLVTKWSFTNSCSEGSGKYTSKYLTYYGTNYARHDNKIYEFTEILNNIPEGQINDFSCHLFCALNSSNNPFRFVEADLYYLKLTKGNTVIRNLIPVKKPSTNEIGLYDMENDYFYVSQGDDPFVAGPKL